MPKTILKAKAQVPNFPTVRFMRHSAPGNASAFEDVTTRVTDVRIDSLDDGSETFALIRLDAGGLLVWQTIHRSLQETRWQAQHEYNIQETDWTEIDAGYPATTAANE